MVRSEFFQVTPGRIFQGFTDLDKAVTAGPEEEVWVELEHYRNFSHMEAVLANISADKAAGPLFGQVMGVLAEDSSPLQGNLNKLAM